MLLHPTLITLHGVRSKNRSMEPMLIWPNIMTAVSEFKDILALTRLQHIVCSKRVIVRKKYLVLNNIQMQMICDIPVLHGKGNSDANFIYISHKTTNNILLQLLTCYVNQLEKCLHECHHLDKCV